MENGELRVSAKCHQRSKAMMDSLVSRDAAAAEALQKTAASSLQMEQAISGAIVGMQFQDRVTQHIQNVSGALAFISRVAAAAASETQSEIGFASAAGPAGPAMLQEIADQFTLSEMRDRFAAKAGLDGISPGLQRVTPETGAGANVDLF